MNLGLALALSGALLFYAFILMIITWRLQAPRRYLYWFFKYWLLLPIGLITSCLAVSGIINGNLQLSLVIEVLAGFITYLAVCASFILVYPAIAMSSLSLEILRHLRRYGPQKIGSLRLTGQSGKAMLQVRRNNLLESAMFTVENEDFYLTRKGRFIASMIHWLRWVLAIPRRAGG